MSFPLPTTRRAAREMVLHVINAAQTHTQSSGAGARARFFTSISRQEVMDDAQSLIRPNQSGILGSRLFFLINVKMSLLLLIPSPATFFFFFCHSDIGARGAKINKSFVSLNEIWERAERPPPSVTFCVAPTDSAITN